MHVKKLFVQIFQVPEDLYEQEEEAFFTLIYNTVDELNGKVLNEQT